MKLHAYMLQKAEGIVQTNGLKNKIVTIEEKLKKSWQYFYREVKS